MLIRENVPRRESVPVAGHFFPTLDSPVLIVHSTLRNCGMHFICTCLQRTDRHETLISSGVLLRVVE
jgi:hypothetical protein